MSRPPLLRAASALLITALTSGLLVGIAAETGHATQIAQDKLVSPTPVAWTPQVLDGKVEAIVQVGSRMIAAGTFSQVQAASGGATLNRSNIFAFDATTGALDTGFTPNVNGEITSMAVAPGGAAVIVGGSFTSVNGTTKTRLARLNATTGAVVTGFTASANSVVNSLATWGNSVVVGGAFKTIDNVTRTGLAAVDATTGALDNRLNLPLSGQFNGGSTNIQQLDVTTDGTQLVLVGNFTAIAGQSRVQVAKVDLSTNPATVSSWATDRYTGACAGSFNTYMRAVTFSPDGSYFVIGDTGAGYFPTTLCDTATRWESNRTGPGQNPTWIDYSGGDTYTQVASTTTAIYVGGHMRWENNDIVGDQPAAGAVPRAGIAALDPQNGMPFTWNPGRDRNVGVFAFLATPAGLWIGHDSQHVAGVFHRRLAMFPLAGGTTPPQGKNATLPGTLYNATKSLCPGVDHSVLFRVNAGGPQIPATDCGAAWGADQSDPSPYRNSESNVGGPWAAVSLNGSVPSTTPRAVFQTERWSPSDTPPMRWSIPIAAGTHAQVRLYFANGYDGTGGTGQRVFNVSIDGNPVLTNYDIVADVGNHVGVMKSFNITSDGTVNIDTSHMTENPLINAIEIIDRDIPPGPNPSSATFLNYRGISTAGVDPSDGTLQTPGTDWSNARGGFFLNGSVYAGWSDGRLYGWTFNGTTLGNRRDILAQGNYVLGPTWIDFSSVTGMFWLDGRLYYTLGGDPNLYYRYFTPQSELVGSVPYAVSGPGVDGLDWSGVQGMTYAGGKLYYASVEGNLHRVDVTNGSPVGGTDAVIGGPGVDGRDWGSNAMFVTAPQGPVDNPPSAPGKPSGSSPSTSSISLSWAASTDDHSTTITYRVYRDGGTSPVGQTTGGTTGSIGFIDAGLTAGSTHTYRVDAVDGSNNISQLSPASDPITVQTGGGGGAIFSDTFASGTFSKWTSNTRMTIDATQGSAAAPSARMATTSQSASAYVDLAQSYASLCASANVHVTVRNNIGLDLIRLRSAGGGPVVKAFLSTTGALSIRSDFAGTQKLSTTNLPAGWSNVELCGAVGASLPWDLYLNGTKVVNGWVADTGSAPITRVQIGDTASKTITANWDDVVVDQAPGN